MEIKLAKKIPCDEEGMSQKQKDQWRAYVADKLDEIWIEQANEQGDIFRDKYLHRECEFIRVVKPNWNGTGTK